MIENLSWFWWVLLYLATCLFFGFPMAITACSVRNNWENPMITGWRDHLILILCFPASLLSESMIDMLRADNDSNGRDGRPGLLASAIENDDTYILIASLLWLPKTVWAICTAPTAVMMVGFVFCVIRIKRLWKKGKKDNSAAH